MRIMERRETVGGSNQQIAEIDLFEMMQLLLRNVHFIIFGTLLIGLLTFAITFFLITPKYQAQITLYVNNMASGNGTTMISQSDINASVQLVDTYSAIITNETLLEAVIEEADVDLTAEELEKRIRIEAVNNTEVFQVMVLDPDPKAAARIGNAIADIAPEQIAEIVDGSSVKVVNRAKVPEGIETPNYFKNTVLGFFIGFVLSAAFIILRELADTSIQVESDLVKWGLPVLGTVPDLDDAKLKKRNGYGYGYQRKAEGN